MKEALETILVALSIVGTLTAGGAWLISLYSKKQEELEKLKSTNTRSALNRLDDEVKSFRFSIDSVQSTIKELSSSLVQNRSDVALLKERLEDTKKMLERYEINHDSKIKNIIKSEITQLTKELMLIRTKRV